MRTLTLISALRNPSCGLLLAVAAAAVAGCGTPGIPDLPDDEDEEGAVGGTRAGGRGGAGRGGTGGISQQSGGSGGSGGATGGMGGARDDAGVGGTTMGTGDARADAGAGGSDGPPGAYVPPKVVISEIMYHPVQEDGAVEEHEFVEIHNRTGEPVPIGGWKLAGGIAFTFPSGLTLAAGGYLVIAKNPAKLAALTKYGLKAADLQGPYVGELDNGGERISLLDQADTVVDTVKYDDAFPWPIAADALGAGEYWLKGENVPLSMHKYMGRSLERISFDIPAGEVVNWAPSPLDGATPGRKNASAGKLEAIVEQLGALRAGGEGLIRKTDKVIIRALFSSRGAISKPQVEYFVQDLERAEPIRTKVDMRPGADGTWEVELPPQGDQTIVRYRILGDRGTGTSEVISPRPTDPYAYHGYFVTPELQGRSPTYFLFISKSNWSRLFEYINAGRVPSGSCKPNPTWNERRPAVLAYEGKVVDIFARYQGSPYNRKNGPSIKTWPAGQWPTQPNPMRALSWRLYIPRYAPVGGKRAIILNKRSYECGGLTTGAGGRVFESVGVPSSQVRFTRLYINGNYYHYMTEVERPAEDMLRRFFGKEHVIGDYFKVMGYNGEQGPYTWSDGRRLPAGCTFTAAQRYDYNYDRKAPDWKAPTAREVMDLVDKLHQARAGGSQALRTFFMQTFDYKPTLDYMAVINWMGPWDDFFQNHFLYRKPDGKWMFTPWDFDNFFGGYVPVTGSFYVGELDDRSNRIVREIKWNNYMKDAFIKTFRNELHQRWRELIQNQLSTATVGKLIDDVAALYSESDARPSATGAVCDKASFITGMKDFTRDRNVRVMSGQFQ
jgi:hypothetical protein